MNSYHPCPLLIFQLLCIQVGPRAAFFPIFMRLVTSQGPGHNVSSQVAHSVKQFLEFLWSWQPITNKLEMAPKFKQFFFHFSFFSGLLKSSFCRREEKKGSGKKERVSSHTKIVHKTGLLSFLQLLPITCQDSEVMTSQGQNTQKSGKRQPCLIHGPF